MKKSHCLEQISSLTAAKEALADELPGQKEPWVISAIDGEAVATITTGTELDGKPNWHLMGEMIVENEHKATLVVELLQRIRRRVGGTIRPLEESCGCHFHLEILAPRGLAGIEPHLSSFRLGLQPWRSGFNGQVILRMSRGDNRFEFEMDPSTTSTMHASGHLDFPEAEAWQYLESLSDILKRAGFPHRILMDAADGYLYRRIDYRMPGEFS